MEESNLNQIQSTSPNETSLSGHEVKQLPEFSFIPPELLKKDGVKMMGMREKCALGGVVLGALALISWIVIIFGALFSLVGIVTSIVGLRSSHPKLARIGLVLSVLGLVASFWYVFAAYQGMINYNYFTSEFWSK